MPANDPAAYDAMGPDELTQSLEQQLDAIVQSAQDIGTPTAATADVEGAELAGPNIEDAAAAMEEAPSSEVESAVADTLSAGITDPVEFITALQTAGFQIVSAGASPIPEGMSEMPPEAAGPPPVGPPPEVPMREARRAAAERPCS